MMCRRQTRRLGLVLSQFLTTAASSSAAAAAAGNCSAPAEVDYDHYLDYKLLDSTPVSPDSKLLRFELPPQHRPTLGLPLPSCLKVKKTFVDEQSGEQYVLDKSYSPVSMPDQPDWVEFLVKGYAARPAGQGLSTAAGVAWARSWSAWSRGRLHRCLRRSRACFTAKPTSLEGGTTSASWQVAPASHRCCK